MVEKVVNFNAKKAETEGDSRLWTVEDALKEALEQSKDGRYSKALLVFEKHDDETGTFQTCFKAAGCTTLEARGLMLSFIMDETLEKLGD